MNLYFLLMGILQNKGILIQKHNGPDPDIPDHRACVRECKLSIQDNAPCAFLSDRLSPKINNLHQFCLFIYYRAKPSGIYTVETVEVRFWSREISVNFDRQRHARFLKPELQMCNHDKNATNYSKSNVYRRNITNQVLTLLESLKFC